MWRDRLPMIVLSILTIATRSWGEQRRRDQSRNTRQAGSTVPHQAPAQVPSAATTASASSFPRDATPQLAGYLDHALLIVGISGLLVIVGLTIRSLLGLGPSLATVLGSGWSFAIMLITLAVWVVYFLWKVPQWQAAARRRESGIGAKELFEMENSARDPRPNPERVSRSRRLALRLATTEQHG